MSRDDFIIKNTRRGWVIIRKDRNYEDHSHFRTRDGCEKLLNFIVSGLMPTNHYFRVAASRILDKSEYDSLRVKQKKVYVNRRKHA